MGIWKLLGKIIQVSPKDTWIITDETQGRLIYEAYDSEEGRSSPKSRYYVVRLAKVIGRNKSDDPEVQGSLQIDLADSNVVEELLDD